MEVFCRPFEEPMLRQDIGRSGEVISAESFVSTTIFVIVNAGSNRSVHSYRRNSETITANSEGQTVGDSSPWLTKSSGKRFWATPSLFARHRQASATWLSLEKKKSDWKSGENRGGGNVNARSRGRSEMF